MTPATSVLGSFSTDLAGASAGGCPLLPRKRRARPFTTDGTTAQIEPSMAGIRLSGEPSHVCLSQDGGPGAAGRVSDPTVRKGVKTTQKFNCIDDRTPPGSSLLRLDGFLIEPERSRGRGDLGIVGQAWTKQGEGAAVIGKTDLSAFSCQSQKSLLWCSDGSDKARLHQQEVCWP
jgi:hypothetical protein